MVNVYAPNEDCPYFFQTVSEQIDSFNNRNIIWSGDFNLVLNTKMDRFMSNYNNIRASAALKEIIDDLDLCDIWRAHNNDKTTYTWCRNRQMSRIDFFLLSSGLVPNCLETAIKYSNLSDHSPIYIRIQTSKVLRGPGLWKLNTAHLSNMEFLTDLNNLTQKLVEFPGELDHVQHWEFVKNEIRNLCIAKSKCISKQKNIELRTLSSEATSLKQKIDEDPENSNTS